MKSQYRMLFAFAVLLIAVGCLCSGSTGTPTAVPPVNVPTATEKPAPTAEQQTPPTVASGSSSDLVTFTDQNNLLAFDLPGDWTYLHVELEDKVYSDANAYSDTFTSPDEAAKMESLVIFSSTTVDNSVSAGAALDLLHRFYSTTGKVGDIRIASDQIMKDGSERFEWSSKSGGYSGVSYFEVRGNNKKTWLMLTAWWSDGADQTVLDSVNNAIASYVIPQ